MNVGCRNFKKGDITKGLLITIDPYKVSGDKNYRSIVKCTLCDSDPYEIVYNDMTLAEIDVKTFNDDHRKLEDDFLNLIMNSLVFVE